VPQIQARIPFQPPKLREAAVELEQEGKIFYVFGGQPESRTTQIE
jgi:hypothetical protein